MVTYELKKAPGVPLYEALYRHLREDILTGKLAPGEKLPSKRALAQNLEVSKITVETAYNQLLSEGYLYAREKVGYFVEQVERRPREVSSEPAAPAQSSPDWLLDLTENGTEGFPFSVWMKLQREVMLDYGQTLLRPLPNRGIPELRRAIARHLGQFRGMRVDPENIILGAGTDFLYNLLIQLLGREKIYAVEEPGYGKIRKIYAAGGVRCVSAYLDSLGVIPESLEQAQVLHCSPSHHYPTGLVTPVNRRLELLDWAGTDKWIIEDDYDSEFRFDAHPVPAMQALDGRGRVIYMNTFTKTLAPSIRISYMVLPHRLLAAFREKLGFYASTVSGFEQYTLARFMAEGYYEKHLNRMRKRYHQKRDAVIACIRGGPLAERARITEEDAGLHFLMTLDTTLPDGVLRRRAAQRGVRLAMLSEYYNDPDDAPPHVLVVNYSGIDIEKLPRALTRLAEIGEEQDHA